MKDVEILLFFSYCSAIINHAWLALPWNGLSLQDQILNGSNTVTAAFPSADHPGWNKRLHEVFKKVTCNFW